MQLNWKELAEKANARMVTALIQDKRRRADRYEKLWEYCKNRINNGKH